MEMRRMANGVVIDVGVGGGIVGSGDAGIHRPPMYPAHPHHVQGYVMAGAYYPPAPYGPPPPAPQDDFADYMWMENEEEFDKQVSVYSGTPKVMQQLEEEALMEQCIEAMLEDEQREQRHRPPVANGHNNHYPSTSNGAISLEETVSRSKLNPLAAEFVPTFARSTPSRASEDKTDSAETAVAESKTQVQCETQSTAESKAETTMPEESQEPPEVSAADVLSSTDRRQREDEKKEKVKVDSKKPTKPDPKKAKPQAVKSEPKLQQKKKEVKNVKSEIKVEKEEPAVIEPLKPVQASPTEEPTPGFKPINYAAAAKANKPKPAKQPSPPATDKCTPQPALKQEKPVKAMEKPKAEKARKNSAK